MIKAHLIILGKQLCLGSKNVEDMYKDGELKGITNRKVEEFLKGKNPHFILTLSKNFEDGAEWRIERRLNLNSKKDKIINIIDGKRYKYSDFNDELKKRLFGFTDDHPSFRELIGKFLRKDDTQISNILKFNHPSTNNSRYEKIHLFLFGFNATELLAQKAQLERETKEVSNTITVLDNASGNGALVQELYLRQSELNDLIIKREKFQINEAYERESQYLEALQKEISLLEKKKAELNLQTKITQERIDKSQGNKATLDSSNLEYLYSEASYYNENLPRTLDKLVNFHNSMLDNEISYLKKQLIKYRKEYEEIEIKFQECASQYSQTLEILSRSGSLAEYTKLNEDIATKSKEIGEAESLLNKLNYYKQQQDKLDVESKQLQDQMQKQMQELDTKIAEFNIIFSNYTELLEGEKYYLYPEKKDGIYQFNIKGMDGNPGTGQKQAVVMAFDLAYMKFANEQGLQRPLFATQDKIEVVDVNKLKSLFTLANQQNGQLIAPVIDDKVNESNFQNLADMTILTLSPTDRFFRIP